MPANTRETGGSEELRDRIVELGDRLWAGNRSQMAMDLDQSKSSVTRVMNKQQQPSGRLIENLAKHPAIDLEWLFRGEGEGPARPETLAMPVFTRLLKGDPANAQVEPDDWFALSAQHFSRTRYWLRVMGDEPVAMANEEAVNAGDLMLMETNRVAFPREPRIWEQLCGVDFGAGEMKLARVSAYEASVDTGPAYIEADPFDLSPKPEQLVREYVIRHPEGQPPVVRVHELLQPESGPARHPTFEDLEPRLPRIKYDQVACVCVLMLRQMPPFSNG